MAQFRRQDPPKGRAPKSTSGSELKTLKAQRSARGRLSLPGLQTPRLSRVPAGWTVSRGGKGRPARSKERRRSLGSVLCPQCSDSTKNYLSRQETDHMTKTKKKHRSITLRIQYDIDMSAYLGELEVCGVCFGDCCPRSLVMGTCP